MYCTIEAFLETNESVLSSLSNVQINYIDAYTGCMYEKGKLDGLEIKKTSRGIKLKGSLAKYYFGNNFQTLSIDQTKEAIEKISDSLHIDVSGANVFRIDFATNLIVSEPPQNYYSLFADASRLNKSQQGTTQYFSNKQRAIVFYDKCNEAKAHNIYKPDEFKNKNVLRYEHRLKRIKQNQIALLDLYSKKTFNWLIDEWLNQYYSIRRVPRFRIKKEVKEMINLKAFELQGWKLFIQHIGGIESFYSMLDDEERRGTISKQNKHYYKKKFDKLFDSPEIFEPNPLIKELDEKVNQAAERYRC
ncbi:MAG: hypothetical protein B6D44_04290 [Ignavibacteriales bacterium UTCHB2]|jgi:hypothetical protein|nr:MAG: hypothetical protein B6D44_04290 [Ignavibacteriales bacterium UTCHB2]